MPTFHVTIRELTDHHRTWPWRGEAEDASDATARAIVAAYGPRHGLQHDHGLPRGYGSIIYNLTDAERRKRASGATWAADVIVQRVRVEVERVVDVEPPARPDYCHGCGALAVGLDAAGRPSCAQCAEGRR